MVVLFLPHRQPLLGPLSVDLALDGKDGIDPAHRINRQRRLRHIGQHEQLTPPTRPTRCLDNWL